MSSFFGRLTELILRRRGAVAILTLLVSVFFLWLMQGLRFDNSDEIWFTEGDPAFERIKTFHKIFGNDDFIYLVFDAENLFTPESLRRLDALVADLRADIPFLRDVTWLGNAEYVEADAESITISDFIELNRPFTLSMSELRERALAERNYRDHFISPDGSTAGIILEMTPYPADIVEPRSQVTLKLREILDRPAYRELGIRAVGRPILHHDYDKLSFRESATFFGICLLVQMALLFWLGNGWRGVVAPVTVVFLSVIWTLGMIQLLGFTLNLFVILIPTLLICVCIGDSMHIIATRDQHVREGLAPRDALRQAMIETGPPCLLTSLTTAAGFLGFCAADLQPFREMGIYASIGAIMAYVLSILVVLVLYGSNRQEALRPVLPAAGYRPSIFDRLLRGICQINVRYHKTLLACFVILSGLSVYGYSLVEVETGTVKMFSTKVPLRQAYDFVDERMGGSMSIEIMLDTGRTDGVKSLDFLRGLERLQNHLEESPLVSNTVSVLDIIKKINEAMHGGDTNAYVLPEGDDVAAQYLFLYEVSNGRELDKLISFDGRVARLTAKTRTLGTGEVRRMSEDLAAFAEEVFADTVTVRMAGRLDWIKSMNDLLADGQRQSFLAALLVVSAIMCFALVSLRLGLLSMLPNIFPVLVTLGLMGVAGIHMDMPLMSFSAIIIGVVVDDTIHFLFHYREAFARTGSYECALEETLLSTGRPMLFTTITLLGGFSVLLLSNMSGISKFGGLGCFAFGWALLADFFLVPAILLTFKPLRRVAGLKTEESA